MPPHISDSRLGSYTLILQAVYESMSEDQPVIP